MSKLPIPALFAQWQRLYLWANSPDCPEGAGDASNDTLGDLERQIVAAETQSPTDLAMKLIAVTNNGDYDFTLSGDPHNAELWAEFRKLADA